MILLICGVVSFKCLANSFGRCRIIRMKLMGNEALKVLFFILILGSAFIHNVWLPSFVAEPFPYEVRATFRNSKWTELCAVFNGRSTLLPAVLYIDLSLMPVTALCLSRFSQKAFGGTTALHYWSRNSMAASKKSCLLVSSLSIGYFWFISTSFSQNWVSNWAV